MATLVSPGVSVTVTDESFFIPVSAPTVPLFFIATAAEKLQPDGETPAEGTFESNVVRTVTSLTRSTQLYGIPNFLEDSGNGDPYHGDARNEYGLFALNQFLGVGNKAYVIRADVNTDDTLESLRALWDSKISTASIVLSNLIQNKINELNIAGNVGSPPGNTGSPLPSPVTTVDAATLQSLATTATGDLFAFSSFQNLSTDYFGAAGTPSNLPMFPNGYDQPQLGAYDGFNYESVGSGSPTGEYTPSAGAALLLSTGDEMKFTAEFLAVSGLGSNDADRRNSIVTELQASIKANTDIRSENFDYNLLLCPNYWETADELVELAIDIQEEALVISDTPMNRDSEGITDPSGGWAITAARQRSVHIAYYYPSALASNLDGKNVVVSASGVACIRCCIKNLYL